MLFRSLSHNGTVSLQQPLIAPLHGGVSSLEFLAFLNQDNTTGSSWEDLSFARDTVFGYELVKEHWQQKIGSSDFETTWWPKALHDGMVAGTELAGESATVNASAMASAVRDYKKPVGFEVVLRSCPKMGDGRFANNS